MSFPGAPFCEAVMLLVVSCNLYTTPLTPKNGGAMVHENKLAGGVVHHRTLGKATGKGKDVAV